MCQNCYNCSFEECKTTLARTSLKHSPRNIFASFSIIIPTLQIDSTQESRKLVWLVGFIDRSWGTSSSSLACLRRHHSESEPITLKRFVYVRRIWLCKSWWTFYLTSPLRRYSKLTTTYLTLIQYEIPYSFFLHVDDDCFLLFFQK